MKLIDMFEALHMVSGGGEGTGRPRGILKSIDDPGPIPDGPQREFIAWIGRDHDVLLALVRGFDAARALEGARAKYGQMPIDILDPESDGDLIKIGEAIHHLVETRQLVQVKAHHE